MNDLINIAIFGSTSHIAKGLIYNFLKNNKFNLDLYTRSPEKLNEFLTSINIKTGTKSSINNISNYDHLFKYSYNVIINCVGTGTLNKPNSNYSDYFTVLEKFDNLALSYLFNKRPETLYISFSSGAIYGRQWSVPAQNNSKNNISVNYITREDYYAIARLYAETKHRSFPNFNIVDLRLFSYFSRFIDLTDGYFITEVIDSIINDNILVTDNVNIVRDYVHPKDLFSIIKKCIYAVKINKSFDVISAKPVEKIEILDYFALEYGLKNKKDNSFNHSSSTGSKKIYYSTFNDATNIGYKPAFSSMDTIKQESEYIIKEKLVKHSVK